ncbi:L-aminoadipate-semialdehyde dehydrogenase-phosphopantetheinyl transferase [Cytospora mali]|uniref:holo-[acyl-carrier-protein] synthase n=1 Tax=Cytospora mali TaxID=578113 RepID=A0A194UWB6_CYTMA|nr:L-aminoadipate-semialdehyde dehydrogenase-phosphopantetheinyl transferase [Valsa mali var. pyri (nom. inval.)]
MAPSSNKPVIVQWIVDTRKLWPNAEKTAQLETAAARALALLTQDERKAVLRYLFVRDAKMALASHLLKHYVISKCCNVPWWETKITRNAKTKPVYVDAASGTSPIEFNVSHQAGLVALVASYGGTEGVDIGVDIVCVNERRDRDHAVINKEGWPSFVDMHADVFAPSEASYLKYQILSAVPGLPAGATPAQLTDFKLRCFYTLWCLREAYVKMTGEALLASWLNVLEFRNFKPPKPTESFEGTLEDGSDVVRVHDIWFKGKKVDDANVCMRSLGPDYMTCTAVRTPHDKEVGLGVDLGAFEMIPIDDILKYAESKV